MINHVRTLLMNRKRDGAALTDYGEEYIAENFVPRKLDQPLQLVHSILFGTKPDRLFINYRMRQLLQLIHATPLAEDIVNDDSRITYLPFKTDLFDAAFRPKVTRIAGPPSQVNVSGEHAANMSIGLAKQLWDLEVIGAHTVTIQKRYGQIETATAVFNNGTPVVLPSSNISVYLHNPAVGYKIQITATARPFNDLSQVIGDITNSLNASGMQDIFPMNAPEPVATWYKIWNNHETAAMRFTALLLAIAYRTSQLPQEPQGV